MQGENEKKAADVGILSEFIQKHRKPIYISAGAVLLVLIAFIAVLSIMETLNNKAISAVEEFGSRYDNLRSSITEEYSAVDIEELLSDLEAFIQKKSFIDSGYAGGKAWSIIAGIHSDRKNWADAEAAWVSAAKAAKKTYLVPLAFFNAGAAAEEQGNLQEAIAHYSSSLSMAAGFPGASRAQFAIGRLRESLNENAAAIEAYRAVISDWSYDQIWTSLARNRLVALEMKEED